MKRVSCALPYFPVAYTLSLASVVAHECEKDAKRMCGFCRALAWSVAWQHRPLLADHVVAVCFTKTSQARSSCLLPLKLVVNFMHSFPTPSKELG